MKPSAKIEQDLQRLSEFRNAYIELVNSSRVDRSDYYSLAKLAPAVSVQRCSELRRQVSVAAGSASAAYDRNGGGTYSLKNAAYLMHGVNPVTNWAMSLEDAEQLSPQRVVSAVETAMGVATARLEDALRNERGVVGLIAAFIRWPQTLREAVGPGRAQRTAAGALGIVDGAHRTSSELLAELPQVAGSG